MGFPILSGKNILVFGALDEHSLAWQIAEELAEHGARVFLTNTPIALRLGKIHQLAEKIQAPLIPADATSEEDLRRLLDEVLQQTGGAGTLHGIVHSVAMSMNIRKKRTYPEIRYDWYQKTLDVSAISLHKILQVAWEKDALAEWGAVLTLSYIAAQRVFPEYNDMADAKALLESIVRNYGYWWGKRKKVRVLAISQSPTPTTAGTGVPGFEEFLKISEESSPLGNASARDCARLCVFLLSDYARMLTMQTLFHDGGFHAMGILTTGKTNT